MITYAYKACYERPTELYREIIECLLRHNKNYPDNQIVWIRISPLTDPNNIFTKKGIGISAYWKFGIMHTRTGIGGKKIISVNLLNQTDLRQILSYASIWYVRYPLVNGKEYQTTVNRCPVKVISFINRYMRFFYNQEIFDKYSLDVWKDETSEKQKIKDTQNYEKWVKIRCWADPILAENKHRNDYQK